MFVLVLLYLEVVEEVANAAVNFSSSSGRDFECFVNNVVTPSKTISWEASFDKTSTNISIRLQLGTDTKIINSIINAYKNYVTITPIPKIGLIIDNEKGKITDVCTSFVIFRSSRCSCKSIS